MSVALRDGGTERVAAAASTARSTKSPTRRVSMDDAGKAAEESVTCTRRHCPKERVLTALAICAAFGLVALWLAAGTLWYHFYLDWTWEMSFYYAVQAGFSVGFGALTEDRCVSLSLSLSLSLSFSALPFTDQYAAAALHAYRTGPRADVVETDRARTDVSRAFTIVFVSVGTCILAGALALYTDLMFNVKASMEEPAREEEGDDDVDDEAENGEEAANVADSDAAVPTAGAGGRTEADGGDFVVGGASIGAYDAEDIESGGSYASSSAYDEYSNAEDDLAVATAMDHESSSEAKSAPKPKSKRRCKCKPSAAECKRFVLLSAMVIWISIACVWGVAAEKWTLIQSLYFAVTAMTTGGMQAPDKNTPGGLLFTAIFCLIGIPLYGGLVGLISAGITALVQQHRLNASLGSALTAKDFAVAQKLADKKKSGAQSAGLGRADFMRLELLRCNITDLGTLKRIDAKFEHLDDDHSGSIETDEMLQYLLCTTLDADGSGVLDIKARRVCLPGFASLEHS